MVRQAAVFVVLGIAGFAAGRWAHVGTISPGDAEPNTGQPRMSWEPARVAVAEPPCDDLVLADTLLATTRADIEGRPVPFPPNPAQGVSPDAFRADLEELKRECPGVTVDYVDCDEYPCLAWVTSTSCPARARFQALERRSGLALPYGDLLMYDVLYRMEPDRKLYESRTFEANAFDRTETRTRGALGALEALTGGTRLSEVERAEEDAAITREELDLLEPDDPDRKHMERLLRDAEHRITAARYAERRW